MRGLEVDDELELCRLHYRHIRGVGTLEDLADIFAGLAIHPTDAWPVAQKSASHRELAYEIHRRQCMAFGEGYDLFAAIQQDWISRDEKGVALREEKLFERGFDSARVAGIEYDGFNTQLPRAILHVRRQAGAHAVDVLPVGGRQEGTVVGKRAPGEWSRR